MSHRKRMLRHGPRTSVLAASIGALVASGGISTLAVGQEAEEESNSSGADTIVVTGTRIRRDDFSAAQATTVVTAEDMQALGVVSVADMVNQLPNNIATVSPESTADSPFYLGASIANMRGLNTSYGVRTLTLLDSRRMTPTNNGGGVDMNFIPSALVGRIETVTGGASATYGADAMAGVVNVILDDNIENIRVDLSYQTSDESDGDQYTLSFGTGYQFFENNRGNLTIGFDSSRQEAIEDCTNREVCRQGLGLMRNGEGGSTGLHADRGGDIIFEGQPEWILQNGHRYTTTPEGVVVGDGYPDLDPSDGTDYSLGWYTFNAEGTDLIPYPTMTPEEMPQEILDAINSVGTQTGLGSFSFQGPGNRWATPWGQGQNIYSDVPIRPETARDNLFLRFTYELEGGIELGADLTYGQTRSESLQNSARNNLQGFCIMPENAYLQPEFGAGETLQGVYQARFASGFSSDQLFGFYLPGGFTPNPDAQSSGCRQAPFLGGSFQNRPDEIEAARYDFAPGLEFHKDFSEQIDRRNINDSESLSLTFSANGTLFEGGSWTWDAYAQFGQTENRQTLSGWRAGRRWDMAIDSVLDGWDTDGDGVWDVPATDPQPAGSTPVAVCSIFSENVFGEDQNGNPVNWGDFIRDHWDDYLFQALDGIPDAQQDQIWTDLSTGCTPFNPFGSQPFTAEQIAYIFPTLEEGTDNDQTALSFSFSGDAWRGIGDAGPMRMAAGIDWRENDTQNIADPNRFLGADFNFSGTSESVQNAQRIYGDNWWGRTTTQEAWVEFDLPLLRNKPGADSLSFNTSFRRSENETQRISGIVGVQTPDTTRAVDSWKASMQWQPVDIMRVRMTRSADTRAPSARELFATNSYATETGGELEVTSPWRFEIDEGAFWAQTESGDIISVLQGGNASLSNERSVTETLGVVFQPVEALPGLQVSIDYYQTVIEGGIRQIDYNDTINACASEIGRDRWDTVPLVAEEDWVICNNILFARDPDQEFYYEGVEQNGDLILGPDEEPISEQTPNPYWDYTDIISVAESTINEQDFVSRGIDYSISYFTQLRGGGSINARALFTRFLEQSVFLENTFGYTDVSGQTGGNNIANYFGSFSANYSPTPRIRGNLFMTYSKNAFSITAQARYTGTGKLNNQNRWLAPGDCTTYQQYINGNPFNAFLPGVNEYCYDPDFERTVTDGNLPSWTTLNLNFNYDFGRSRFELDRFESLNAYFNIENVGDRIPNFFSGTGAGGINTSLFSAMGRSYRMGVRMEF